MGKSFKTENQFLKPNFILIITNIYQFRNVNRKGIESLHTLLDDYGSRKTGKILGRDLPWGSGSDCGVKNETK